MLLRSHADRSPYMFVPIQGKVVFLDAVKNQTMLLLPAGETRLSASRLQQRHQAWGCWTEPQHPARATKDDPPSCWPWPRRAPSRGAAPAAPDQAAVGTPRTRSTCARPCPRRGPGSYSVRTSPCCRCTCRGFKVFQGLRGILNTELSYVQAQSLVLQRARRPSVVTSLHRRECHMSPCACHQAAPATVQQACWWSPPRGADYWK